MIQFLVLPEEFKKTNDGDQFLLYDSFEDDLYNLDCGRILVFGTKDNLRVLSKTDIWFLDGTFKVVPTIFFQLFTIFGSVTQQYKGTERKIAVPLVYALLESKAEKAYSKVIEVTLSMAEKWGIRVNQPSTVMTDFELGIINSVKTHLPPDSIRLCLFHLCQSVYRKIQAEGLQEQYGDKDDTRIREASKNMCALAFVPVEDVTDIFDALYNELPEEFLPVANYFEVNYIRGIRAIGRRKAVAVRYAPALWNHYTSVLQGTARTNNSSEGWHNRFQLLVGKRHPSLYSFLRELQKEQSDVEYIRRELRLGKRVKNMPKNSLQRVEDRIRAIVDNYQSFKDEDKELEYLQSLGFNLHL